MPERHAPVDFSTLMGGLLEAVASSRQHDWDFTTTPGDLHDILCRKCGQPLDEAIASRPDGTGAFKHCPGRGR